MHCNVQEYADAKQGGSHSCEHTHQYTKETGMMTDANNGGTGINGKAFSMRGCLQTHAGRHGLQTSIQVAAPV